MCWISPTHHIIFGVLFDMHSDKLFDALPNVFLDVLF